jgi:ElaB/YqjD/DUF883 family membrane-anchored ribosome-binding protein
VEQAHVAGEYVRHGAETTSRGTRRRLDGASKSVDRGYTRARRGLARASSAASTYATENPGKALLLAASAGFVLGMLVHRHRLSA